MPISDWEPRFRTWGAAVSSSAARHLLKYWEPRFHLPRQAYYFNIGNRKVYFPRQAYYFNIGSRGFIFRGKPFILTLIAAAAESKEHPDVS